MKRFFLTLVVIFPALAYSCPDLNGTYQCVSSPRGLKGTFDFSTSANGKISTYTFSADFAGKEGGWCGGDGPCSSIVADGTEHALGDDGWYSALCVRDNLYFWVGGHTLEHLVFSLDSDDNLKIANYSPPKAAPGQTYECVRK